MPDLSSNSRELLLDLARRSIQMRLASGDTPDFKADAEEFRMQCGCFVTLWKDGKLRGCVGTFDRDTPLYLNVIRMAVASAIQDRRFPPVTKAELGRLIIEISILGELRKIDSIKEIETGKHGVYVRLGHKSGTFLPDVAVEQKWGPEEFVIQCARWKAGLSPEECASAEVFVYDVVKISEKKPRG